MGTSRNFDRLESLDCFDKVEKMLKFNYSYTEIAKYIQEDENEYTDVKQDTLRRYLNEYYEEAIPDIEKIKYENPDKIQEFEERLEAEVDVLREFKELYFYQKDRVQQLRAQEVSADKLKGGTGDEIDRAVSIMNEIAEHRKDIGLDERNIGHLSAEAEVRQTSEDATGVDGPFISNPQRRNKIVKFIERLRGTDDDSFQAMLENMGEKVIDAEYEEVESEGDDQTDD